MLKKSLFRKPKNELENQGERKPGTAICARRYVRILSGM